MHALELVVLLGAALLVGHVLARRSGIAPPLVLLAVGALVGLIPAVRQMQLPPEVVLLLFLPVLLYWESLTTSMREIRNNLRGIVLMSTLLVIATAGTVAVAAHALGLPWGPAWVLGAAVAPTDATAVGAFAKSLPRRQVTVLRGESLINDGTALVVFGLAVGITVGEEHFSVPHVSALFLLAYGGGAAVGALVAWVNMNLRRRLDDPLLGNLVMILAPFTAYLLAEFIHASGVVAVVVSGLIMAYVAPRIIRAEHRRQAMAVWPLATFIINGILFLLVGVEIQYALRHLSRSDLGTALIAIGLISVLLVAVRFAFLFASAYLIRLIDRRPKQRLLRIDNRTRTVSGVAGFRGAVSLAVALSVPVLLDSGAPFPDRDFIVFVTSGVIVVTLVVQGLLLPRIVRWARIPRDTSVDEERSLAETLATEEAMAALPEIAADLGSDPEVVDWARQEYEANLAAVRAEGAGTADDPAVRRSRDHAALRLALIDHKRATVVRLRDERRIDDTVLRRLQASLDDEEVRLTAREVE
ncbi:Na+/H+ antiporter [Glycomyces algeriensis]|uniref:Na(+)/H(+) exchanger n=1 Tax=Glycomyces algeriensis TaxID=256037 RepID=A0A9W6LHX7_9ACTN|nr:Na+/H+ antiporter [Glycomyces algeriensis]MDA1365634.1 Na+/H+ antiporter [Glycomyces algeriensis]MDR7351322.1 CPA1 family monovalent cation:H+ antiporter [Glycomyces algeriensis]GLI44038.1 putative Na(+)/H(+) exchanger [Glycomyces algeriensis]